MAESENQAAMDPPLTAVETRILGVLVEKQATTPETYPLTLNAVVTACNQKTARDPVMNLEPGQVGQALRALERRSLTRMESGARADRWAHRLDRALELVPAQLALLALLMLRGPQTAGELLNRSGRMHHFNDVEELNHHLGRLIHRGLAVELPRQSGQREERYGHLLAGPVAQPPEPATAETASSRGSTGLAQRIDELEARVAELEARLQGSHRG